jgi:hypothetical protein
MKKAIRIVVLMVGVLATFASVAAPFPDGFPRPGFTAPVHQPAPDGFPRPDGR